jgi:hypothetical protein
LDLWIFWPLLCSKTFFFLLIICIWCILVSKHQNVDSFQTIWQGLNLCLVVWCFCVNWWNMNSSIGLLLLVWYLIVELLFTLISPHIPNVFISFTPTHLCSELHLMLQVNFSHPTLLYIILKCIVCHFWGGNCKVLFETYTKFIELRTLLALFDLQFDMK